MPERTADQILAKLPMDQRTGVSLYRRDSGNPNAKRPIWGISVNTEAGPVEMQISKGEAYLLERRLQNDGFEFDSRRL